MAGAFAAPIGAQTYPTNFRCAPGISVDVPSSRFDGPMPRKQLHVPQAASGAMDVAGRDSDEATSPRMGRATFEVEFLKEIQCSYRFCSRSARPIRSCAISADRNHAGSSPSSILSSSGEKCRFCQRREESSHFLGKASIIEADEMCQGRSHSCGGCRRPREQFVECCVLSGPRPIAGVPFALDLALLPAALALGKDQSVREPYSGALLASAFADHHQ